METIEVTLARFQAFIGETYPNVDISPGSVLGELLLKTSTQVNNELTNNAVESLSTAKTVSDILNSATETYSDIVSSIASNYNVSRDDGTKVTGIIKVTVSSAGNYFLQEGFKFGQPNLKFNYVTTQQYEISDFPAGTILTANQLQLKTEGGLFYFLIPVEAESVGEESINGSNNNTQVSNKTQFALSEGNSLVNFVGAEAYGSFSSGRNKETDRQLITRFKEGLSYKGLTSPNAMAAVFKDKFPEFRTMSVVGSNDAEVVRAKNNIFGISTLGMADVYIRTSANIQTAKFLIQATNISSSTWQLTVPSTLAPGFYRVISVAPAEGTFTGTYVITDVNYGIDALSTNKYNAIGNALDARLTKYQNCTVTFTCDESGAPKNFLVTIAYMPQIQEIQDYVLSDGNRIVSADYLVRAVVPCSVTMNLKLYKKYSTDTLPITQIKQDIFNYINNIPFGEDLIVSNIVDICHNYKVKRVDLPIVITGTIWVPATDKDDSLIITSDDVLAIPDSTSKGISKKTTLFFGNYYDDNGNENIGIQEL